MSTDEDRISDQRPSGTPGEGTRLEAHASGEARVYQAGRDQNFHYIDGAHDRRRTVSGTPVRECPYPGLAAFEPEQAKWFFGRDGLIAELTARLDRRLSAGGVQVVVAPSGAGKSSLLRAGLLPKLDQAALPGSDLWPKLWLTPHRAARPSAGHRHRAGRGGRGTHRQPARVPLDTAALATGTRSSGAGGGPVRGAVHPLYR